VFSSGVVGDGSTVKTGHRGFEKRSRQQAAEKVARLLAIARKEIGVRETSENSGPRVDEYNKYVGLKKAKWCASFVSWCHGQAGLAAPRTAWSPSLFPKDRIATEAMPGLVMGMYFDSLKRVAHCGIVEGVRNDLIYTVEGNTNMAGSREGDGVYRKIRHQRTIHRYSDWLSSSSLRGRTSASRSKLPGRGPSTEQSQNKYEIASSRKASRNDGEVK